MTYSFLRIDSESIAIHANGSLIGFTTSKADARAVCKFLETLVPGGIVAENLRASLQLTAQQERAV